MKFIAFILLLLCGCAAARPKPAGVKPVAPHSSRMAGAALIAPMRMVRVSWDYSPELTNAVSFRIYHSPELFTPIRQWPTVEVSGAQLFYDFPMQDYEFFAVTAFDEFCESDFGVIDTGPGGGGAGIP